jgi:hypothetical protein
LRKGLDVRAYRRWGWAGDHLISYSESKIPGGPHSFVADIIMQEKTQDKTKQPTGFDSSEFLQECLPTPDSFAVITCALTAVASAVVDLEADVERRSDVFSWMDEGRLEYTRIARHSVAAARAELCWIEAQANRSADVAELEVLASDRRSEVMRIMLDVVMSDALGPIQAARIKAWYLPIVEDALNMLARAAVRLERQGGSWEDWQTPMDERDERAHEIADRWVVHARPFRTWCRAEPT